MSSTHVCLPIYGGLWTVAGDGYDEVDAAEDEGLSTTANNATAIGCDSTRMKPMLMAKMTMFVMAMLKITELIVVRILLMMICRLACRKRRHQIE